MRDKRSVKPNAYRIAAWTGVCLVVAMAIVLATVSGDRFADARLRPLAEWVTWVEPDPQNPVELQAHKGTVQKELAELGPRHAWAGDYVWSNGFEYQGLTLAPKAGAMWVSGSDVIAPVNPIEGPVQVGMDGSLRLSWPDQVSRSSGRHIPTELIPVQWGERRYLIPPQMQSRFAEQINLGHEPRFSTMNRVPESLEGLVLLRRGDEIMPVIGLPQLPGGPLPGVRLTPIPVGVLEVVVRRTTRWQKHCSVEYGLVLDQGEHAGLRVGDQLDLVFSGLSERLQIERIGPGRSTGVWTHDSCYPLLAALRRAKVSRGFYDPVAAQAQITEEWARQAEQLLRPDPAASTRP